ncbi:hypothetical protein [Niallia taxi]|uniref:hypothetical protein n=1 Tax=Niallia taxi TaxID=2499688 RepID=UPI003009A3EB
MCKKTEIKGLIDDLRTSPDAHLSREGRLLLAKLIDEYQERLNEINEIANDFYSEGDKIKKLPSELHSISGQIQVLCKVSDINSKWY